MTSVTAENLVVGPQALGHANRGSFLPDAQVDRRTHLTLGVVARDGFFHPADSEHLKEGLGVLPVSHAPSPYEEWPGNARRQSLGVRDSISIG